MRLVFNYKCKKTKHKHNFHCNFYFNRRTRGVPSNLLGSGHFDDNSSDNSAEEKCIDTKQQTKIFGENGATATTNDPVKSELNEHLKEIPNRNLTETSNNNNTDKYNCTDDSHCDHDDERITNNDEKCTDILSSSVPEKDTSLKNEIPLPLGTPRPENTARLRRYRLNLE